MTDQEPTTRECPIWVRSLVGTVASFVAFALAILGVQSIVDTVRGHHVADPRENNCAECSFNGYLPVAGEVGSPPERLDFGSSTRWRIDAVWRSGFSDVGPSGEPEQAWVCHSPNRGMAGLIVAIPGGQTEVQLECPEVAVEDLEGKESVLMWRWAIVDWSGVKATQSWRGGAVTETPVTGRYLYKAAVFPTLVPKRE